MEGQTNFVLKTLYRTNTEKENNDLVNLVKSGLSNLENEIEKMSEDDIEIEKPDKIVLLEVFLSLMDRINKDKD